MAGNRSVGGWGAGVLHGHRESVTLASATAAHALKISDCSHAGKYFLAFRKVA